MWLDFATRMTAAGFRSSRGTSPRDGPAHVRDVALDALGQEADKYMRSPQFLQAIKQTMDASIAARKQLNDLLAGAHHSVQGVAKAGPGRAVVSMRHMENARAGPSGDTGGAPG
jgi:hypothetical protein